MKLHEHFLKIAALDLSIIDTVDNTSVIFTLTKSIENCFTKLKTCFNKKHLESLRLLLCQLYKYNYKLKSNDKIKFSTGFNQLIEFFINNKLCSNKENDVIIFDIITLHLVLFEDQNYFISLFQDFRTLITLSQPINGLSRNCYFKVLECFLECWEICSFLNCKQNSNKINSSHLESCKNVLISSIMYDLRINVSRKQTNDEEWHCLHSVVSKIVGITKSNTFLSSYVDEILLNSDDSALTILCVLCDFIFPRVSANFDTVDYTLALKPSLYLLIRNKLISARFPERKQALYLIKMLVEFVKANRDGVKKAQQSSLLTGGHPFICDCDGSETIRTNVPIEDLTMNFILIMESLEEKQKHLVIPSLSLLGDLEKGWQQHKRRGNCFEIDWIYCVYAKILKHDNNSVVKWGLMRLLNFDATDDTAIDCDFTKLIVKSLNNSFLYEKDVDESDPEISFALRDWLVSRHRRDPKAIKMFVNLLSECTWGPIPIFYILNSLFDASGELQQGSIEEWDKDQLDSIRRLTETSIKLHPPMLRSVSQVTLVRLISRFGGLKNLVEMSNLLSVWFSEKDILRTSTTCCCRLPALSELVDRVRYDVASDFIRQYCREIRTNGEIGTKDGKISLFVAALITQLYEKKIICQTDRCLVGQELKVLFLSLHNVDVRPYVDFSFVIKAIDLLYNLLNLQRPIPELILQLYVNCKESIFGFVLKCLNNDSLTYEQAQVCRRALKSVKFHVKHQHHNNEVECKSNRISVLISDDNKNELEEKCIQVLLTNAHKHSQVQLLLALQLWSDNSYLFHYDNQFFLNVIRELLRVSKSRNVRTNNESIGKIAQDYFTALSKLMKNHVLTLSPTELSEMPDDWLDVVSRVLDVSGNQVLAHLSHAMYAYSSSIAIRSDGDGKLEKIRLLTKSFWNCNFGSKRDRVFWIVSERLTSCVNRPNFSNGCKSLQQVSEEFTHRMLVEGDALPGLKYILLTRSEISSNFDRFASTVLNGLLHGQVLRRDQRIGVQACSKGKRLSRSTREPPDYTKIDKLEAHDYLNRQCNVDVAVRAAAVLQLCRAIQHRQDNASLFLPLVLEKLSPMKKKRYFADSQLHRLKQRIFQILLILQPSLNTESTTILYDTLCDSLIEDTDQHSIRLMREWLLVRIYLSDHTLIPALWEFFDKVYNERPGSISSLINIIWQVAHRLNKKEQFEDFIGTALFKLGTCGMGQQFSMRLFGQVFFVKLYELLDDGCDTKLEYATFYKAIAKSLNSANFKKNPIKIDEDFFYSVFDPLNHYSLETMYHQLPRLSNVSFEEWITKENFQEQLHLDNLQINISVINSDTLLDQSEIPLSILKFNKHSKSEEIECSDNITDMQKKIMPWRTILPNEDELEEMGNLSSLKNDTRSKQSIIVIASLVDKSQNLGGIARTCEIFGVKELVISNFKQVEEKDFQALSVSADKWIKIIEVKVFLLDKYLLELKDSGWKLVGAEQTANSENLFDFKFPNKTALILGNEKNGIPDNIIPLLDVCVEIPQFGIVRSLNVHVTSAICIWEYVKQYQYIKQNTVL